MGKPGFPIPPAHGRVWEGKALPGEPCYPLADAGRRPAHPRPHPREGLGGRSPPRNSLMFIAAWCGAAAWTADVNIGPRGVGKSGFPRPLPAGGFGRATPSPRGLGKAGFPRPPPAGGFGRCAPSIRGLGNPGFPRPSPGGRVCGAQPARRRVGKPGFPTPPPGGQVWENCALTRRTHVHAVRGATGPPNVFLENLPRVERPTMESTWRARLRSHQQDHEEPSPWSCGFGQRMGGRQGRRPSLQPVPA